MVQIRILPEGATMTNPASFTTTQQTLQEAIAHHQAGRLEDAEQLYDTILETDPDHASALQLKGLIFAARDQADEAINHMEHSLSINPKQPSVHYNLGTLHLKLNHPEDASAYFAAALEQQPDYPQASLSLAEALIFSKRAADAEEPLRLLLARHPNFAPGQMKLGLLLQSLNRLDEAAACYRKCIELEPTNSAADFNLGVVAEAQNKPDEAVEAYRRAVAKDPKLAAAHYNLGVIAKTNQDTEAAAAYFRAAVEAQPDYIEALNNLGTVLQAQDKVEEAASYYQKALDIRDDFPATWHNMGLAQQHLGNLDKAIHAYGKAIDLKHNMPETHFNLGAIYHAQNRHDDAKAQYEKAIALNPRFGEAQYRLATLLIREGEYAEAEKHARLGVRHTQQHDAEAYHTLGLAQKQQEKLEEARLNFSKCVKMDPTYAGAQMNLGNVYKDMGKLKKAEQHYLLALDARPDYADSLNNLANLYLMQGDKKKAEDYFRRAIELKPDFGHAHRHLSATIKYSVDDPLIPQMEALYQNAELAEEERMHIAFSLAKAYSDTKQYEKVFPVLQVANAIRRKDYPDYSTETVRETIHNIIKTYSKEFLQNAPSSGLKSNLPIFIMGMPRSGTTLIEQILSSHNDVHGADELIYMQTVAIKESTAMTGKDFIGAAQEYNSSQLKALGNLYLERLRKHASKAKRITDKMPSNTYYAGLIHMALPNAKIILCRRDPMAVCLSIYKLYFSGPQPFAYDMEELAHQYLLQQELMDHWREAIPDQVYDLQYETLVENQEEESKKLFQFLGLDWQEQCLEFYKSKRSVKTASLVQVRNPIYTSSLKPWEPYAKELEPIARILGIKL